MKNDITGDTATYAIPVRKAVLDPSPRVTGPIEAATLPLLQVIKHSMGVLEGVEVETPQEAAVRAAIDRQLNYLDYEED